MCQCYCLLLNNKLSSFQLEIKQIQFSYILLIRKEIFSKTTGNKAH